MEQFIQLDMSVITDDKLSLKEAVMYSLICDRMKSSRRRANFYDLDKNDYYVIYPIAEMAKILKISKPTAVKCLKNLERLGYIIKKKVFNKATRIFTPAFGQEIQDSEQEQNGQQDDQSKKTLTTKVKKFKSNHNDFNHTNFTNNTEDTIKSVSEIEYQQLKSSIIEVGGFSKHCASIIFALSYGNIDDVREVVGTIYKAKSTVINANKDYGDAKNILLLESDYNSNLGYYLTSILVKANRAKNKLGYIYTAFKNHFESVLLRAKIDKSTAGKPDIPMFKLA